jgi:chemotaxis protein CheD
MKLSRSPGETLVAANLGSCVGVAMYDAEAGVGAVIHCLLPMSKSDPAKAKENPFQYVDTGIVRMLELLVQAGADKRRLSISAAGGANINDDNNIFEIGRKNVTVLRKILWKNNLLLRSEHFGDSVSRTLSLEIGSGKALLKCRGQVQEL